MERKIIGIILNQLTALKNIINSRKVSFLYCYIFLECLYLETKLNRRFL